MRSFLVLAGIFLLAAFSARAADFSELRHLSAGPPTVATPLPAGTAPPGVEFYRIVFHPAEGTPWAVRYVSVPTGQFAMALAGQPINRAGPIAQTVTWDAGRIEAEAASFSRAFDEELRKVGFKPPPTSLFGADGAGAEFKVAVLVDDLRGRFCTDCPNMLNRNASAATVMMTAQWEIYSNLDRRVVARVTTTGGTNYMPKLTGSVMPPLLDAFREHTRQLISSPDFIRAVTQSPGASGPAAAPAMPAGERIAFRPGQAQPGLAAASRSVVVVYAADGAGSGFLISPDGYVLTNHHVVGASKFVKLKWLDGSETLGEVLRSDPRRDVALVKVDSRGREAMTIRSGALEVGETVFAIGTPLDDRLQNTLTKGIVSALRTQGGLPVIQSDVAVTHGNSGGPLLDEKARVVGLTMSGREANGAPVGLNFFIPIDDALRALALAPTPAASPQPTLSKPGGPRYPTRRPG